MFTLTAISIRIKDSQTNAQWEIKLSFGLFKLETGYKNIFEKISSGKTSKGSYPVQQEKPVKTGKAG